MAGVVEQEQQQTLTRFGIIEELETVASAVDSSAARVLRRIADQMIDELGPIRISVAASLLQLSTPTVRLWASRGVLTPTDATGSPVSRLDPHRLHEVLHLVSDLRDQGAKSQALLDEVWHRLDDQATLERRDLQEGLEAMRSGDVVDA